MRVLVTGASGMLGGYLTRELGRRGHHVLAAVRGGAPTASPGAAEVLSLELTDDRSIERVIGGASPDIIIHAAALASIALAQADPELAHRVNVHATGELTRAALRANARCRVVFVSTDMVFDGLAAPYDETASPGPRSVYGRSKLAGERACLDHGGTAIVRLSLLFGPSLTGRKTFFDSQIEALRSQCELPLFVDEWRTPLSYREAATGLAAWTEDSAPGVFHLGGVERLSRFAMGEALAAHLGVSTHCLRAVRQADIPQAEPRPPDLSLDSTAWSKRFPRHERTPLAASLRLLTEVAATGML